LNTNPAKDVEVFEETDETFNTAAYRTKSGKYIIIASFSTISTEYRFLNASNPEGTFTIFQERAPNHEYAIFHYEDHFYVHTNVDNAFNFKLMKTSESKTSKENWQTLIDHREEVLLEDVSIFKDFLVLEERENGLCKIRIKNWDDSKDDYLPFEEEVYDAGVGYNPDFETSMLRIAYSSMTTPTTIFDFNVNDGTKTIKKEQKVLGGKFQKDNYKSFRLWAKAADGVEIPMSVVVRKDTKINSETPLLLYGYGSYGITVDPRFSSSRLSLLDRGFIFVIAHVRGGEYLGRKWYENGRMLSKKNTFTDFIACAEHLIKNNYTSSNHLYASGGSAGGLLMGGIINMKPEIFKGIVADVPFVDVLTTMLDKTIPLTTGEYNEWGNPEDLEYYNYIKSYSPYDNVEAKEYPNMLVTTGLHDSQVQYFEPAKWVAKLRELKTDNNLLLLYTDMDSGHGGASGRFDVLKDIARSYSFLIDLEKNDA
jgi:oligopeptidase B